MVESSGKGNDFSGAGYDPNTTSDPKKIANAENKENSFNIKPFDSLVYPMEMRPDNFYPEAMCFTIKKRIGLSLDDVAQEVTGQWDASKGRIVNRDAEKKSIDQDADIDMDHSDESERERIDAKRIVDKKAVGNTILLKELRTGTGNGVRNLRAKQSLRRQTAATTNANNIGHIYLNMPQAIQYSDSISWDAKPLGAIGAAAKSLASGDGGAGEALGGGAIGVAGNIAGTGIGGMIGLLADKLKLPSGIGLGLISGALGGGALQSGIEATLGMTSNPYEEMMFSGITFRSFSFDFIFRPESADEIIVIDKIIRAFRRYSRPSFVGGKLGKSIMNYPMEFQIEFLTADWGNSRLKGREVQQSISSETTYKENKHLPKIKACVCESINTNYTPNSVWAAYAKGAPVAISLSLSFKEKELVMDADITDQSLTQHGY